MPNAPTSGFPNPIDITDMGNGTVHDNVTCLTWQKTLNTPTPASLGVTSPGVLTDSVAYCAALATSSYGGFSDWRMPTRIELTSVLDYTRTAGALSPPLTGTSGFDRTFSLWYETIAVIGNPPAMLGWATNLSGNTSTYSGSGLTSNAFGDATDAVTRCVRGNGSGEALMQQAVEPPNHYTIATGEVTDNYTGLIWQQVYSAAVMPWASAAGYCSGLGLNGHTWRMPSLKEMSTLVNEATVGPAVNGTAFPKTVFCGNTTWYWGAEQAVTLPGTAWAINFCDGYTSLSTSTTFTTAFVRCVR